MNAEGKRALNVDTVAYQLGVHPHTVRKLIQDGRLRAIRAGKRYLIPVEEVDRFLNGDT